MTQSDGDNKWSLEKQGNYLLLLAQYQMPHQLKSRFDPADAVQKTLLQAHRKLGQCVAETETQFRAWLRAILTNVMVEELRQFGRKQGEGGPDVSIFQAMEESSQRFERFLAADDSTPRQRMMREEQLVRLAAALAALPEDQQVAVHLHHLDGLSLVEVGKRMNRSKEAVAGLLFRALKRLRDDLGETSERKP
jgi:RNA polymerase sigma-70 factor (ECF subfamily)